MADETTGLEARDFEAQHGSGQGRGRMARWDEGSHGSPLSGDGM